jgi:tRNA modification GTPase
MALPPLGDTIAAIATAPGVGAVGIVRLAGPESFAIAGGVFRARAGKRVVETPAGRVLFGRIVDGDETIDEALLLTFRAPHSYTGQDVIELQTHGGPAVLRAVLELVLARGARPAGPGEFTLRAFMNGRLDLVQAEAVLDLVNAQSERARRGAAMGLTKALSERLELIQSDITQVYGNLQAVFDYPDEGVEESEFGEPLGRALARIDRLLATARAGRIAQRGARLALVGRPNAGKSSLLNALLGFERSIVSERPGTTRDYLEAPLDIGGIPITAVDTAGLRETADLIEAAGVTSARRVAESADLTVLLFDGSAPLQEDDLSLARSLDPVRSLVVASKADLEGAWSDKSLGVPVLHVSAKTGEGLDALRDRIREHLVGDAAGSELWISNERHTQALEGAREAVSRALSAPEDLAALDLLEALRALTEISGRDVTEETLEHIFKNFCVGK